MFNRPSIHSPNIQRTQVKLYIKDLILQHLYGKSEQVFRGIYKSIHDEQKELVKAHAKDFVFRNRRHTYGPVYDTHIPHNLHPSLHERMQKYLDDHAQVITFEKPCVDGVLKAMFTHTEWLHDYFDLLPDSLYPCFDGYKDMFLEPANKAMGPEGLAEFKVRNERYLQMIRNRMLMNILL